MDPSAGNETEDEASKLRGPDEDKAWEQVHVSPELLRALAPIGLRGKGKDGKGKKGKGDKDKNKSKKKFTDSKFKGKCNFCGLTGHKEADCRKKAAAVKAGGANAGKPSVEAITEEVRALTFDSEDDENGNWQCMALT